MNTWPGIDQRVRRARRPCPGHHRGRGGIDRCPVADVDRSKHFYKAMGWRLDADLAGEGDFRAVQLTPPGSRTSIVIGTGITSAAPGSVEGLHLVVTDIESARADLVARGVKVSEVFHDAGAVFHHAGTEDRITGPDPAATPHWPRSPTRTATTGCSRTSRHAFRAGETVGGAAGTADPCAPLRSDRSASVRPA